VALVTKTVSQCARNSNRHSSGESERWPGTHSLADDGDGIGAAVRSSSELRLAEQFYEHSALPELLAVAQ
jgi:hypothetical protein